MALASNPFTSEYGRFSATKTIWTAFAVVFLLRLVFQGAVLELDGLVWEITFSGVDCAAVLGANGAIYAWRRQSECRYGRPDQPKPGGEDAGAA